METLHILLFYKYVNIENPEKFMKEHLAYCKELGLLGRILVANEGINGSVCGTEEQTETYKKHMLADGRFNGMQFKEDLGTMYPFKKMVIKIKPEIVRFGVDVDLKNTGKHISPEEFLKLYENKEDVVILDARNNYEWKAGKFRDAVTLDIENFRDFPQATDKLAHLKDKKVVMYCTGGIRCEKASAYLVEKGFRDVSQLDGGILTFAKKYPDTTWEGTCFVFDKRLISAVNTTGSPITNCEICDEVCDLHRNCKTCNKLIVCCPNCKIKMNGCCSDWCLDHLQKKILNSKNN